MSDVYDDSIPVLAEILVPGNPARARGAAPFPDPAGAASVVSGAHSLDVDTLVERLRGRCLDYLSGDGRATIEARCHGAINEHSSWLVGQITREVGLALEMELIAWVRAAVAEELAARQGPAQSDEA
ncbi:DUF2486 domain-containing protein [Burkholderia sp. WAC0059]|uniref:DUF2486 family protein n=1 Tax=Burkholderia sp. WAC0059 TaxID=2066022 RepID=UPI000C7F273B|nr:DUF2486 family protein [Burkholderia sp. WAC0059]PLZ00513.1 DUF2486 domain-containing protein [Burkholderia sp. WAC0059]